MSNDTFCRPVVDFNKKKYFGIGLLAGGALFFVVAMLMGWLTFS
jgi:hypothetical protein